MKHNRLLLMAAVFSLVITRYAIPAERNPGERYLKAAARPGITVLQKAAYEQLAKIHAEGDFSMPLDPSSTYLDSPAGTYTGFQTRGDPAGVLFRMGVEVLPTLTDALDDETPYTGTSGWAGSSGTLFLGPSSVGPGDKSKMILKAKVNEVVAWLICCIAERPLWIHVGREMLYIGIVGKRPDLVPDARKVVLEWYETNHTKTPVQRKVDIILNNNEAWYTRAVAIYWIGKHKEKAGKAAVVAYANHALEQGTIDHLALPACAVTLGQLGDRDVVDVVRRICKAIASEPHLGLADVSGRGHLFDAFDALEMLGEKEESQREKEKIWHELGRQILDKK
jgi:hypothetical protein